MKIMISSPITSWQIDGETMETVADFIFLGSKITADGDRSEIKRQEMATHSSILAWRIPWREEPGRLQSTTAQSRTRLKRLSSMTTGKTIALTRQTFVGKVMSLLFNMLSRLVITFLPRGKHLLISWVQSPICSDFGAQKNKI